MNLDEITLRAPSDPVESVLSPHPYQQRLAKDQARFLIVMWSRQVGKSFGASLLVNDDILGVEAKGRRTLWTLISRSLPQARELALKVRDVGRAVMAAMNILQGLEIEEKKGNKLEDTTYEIRYPGGSRVIVVSANPDSAAGYTGNVLWDEFGLTKRASELFGTAFPVVSRSGGRFIMMSTPRPGFFWKMWDESQRPDSIWASDRMDIYEAVEQGCPQDPEMLRKALRGNELQWRQEFLCERIDDEICWLPWEMIVACTDSLATTTPDDTDDEVYAGWDVARWDHLSVLYLVRRSGTHLVTCGTLVMRRTPFDDQIDLIVRTLKRYPKFIRLCVDAGGMGEMPFEQIKKRLPGRVEPVKFSNTINATLAGDIRRLMEDRTFLVPDDEELRADLHSVRCTTTVAGNKRFEGELKGSHADIFWAATLALHGAINNPHVPFEFTPAGECVYAGEAVL